MNTYYKILITTLPLVLLFLFAVAGTTYYFSYSALTDLAETWLETRLSEAMEAAAEQNRNLRAYGLEAVPAGIAKAKLDAGTMMAAIKIKSQGYLFAVDGDGVITAHPDKTFLGRSVGQEAWFGRLKPGKGRLVYLTREGRTLGMYDYFKPWDWYIVAADPEREVYGLANRMTPYIIYLVILCTIVLAAALMITTKRLTGRLRSLTDGAERIGAGDLETRIAVDSRDELGRLGWVFNQMAGNLKGTLTKLQHREEHFRSLIENAMDIIAILSAEAGIMYVSPSAERILGYPPGELEGKNTLDFVHPEDLPGVQKLFQALARTPGNTVSLEFRFRHNDGDYRVLESASKNLLDHPAVKGIVVNSRDVTRRRRAEEALQKSHLELEHRVTERTAELLETNQRTEAILRASPVGIGLIIDRRLGWANAAMYNMVGYAKDSLLGKSARILYVNHGEFERVDRELFDSTPGPEIRQVQTQWVRKDGSVFDCLLRACPLDPEDISRGQISAVADISDTKRLESALQRARKMEAIGTLAGGVAHDLNNILSAIVSYPELLLLNLPPDDPMRKPLMTIQKSGERAAAVVQDLLTMARRGVAVTEVVNLNTIIGDLLKSPEFQKLRTYHPEARVSFDLEPQLMNVMGSTIHLSKTIMNLIANAAEAMPQGGSIVLASRNVYIDRPLSGYEKVEEGDYVTVAVSDTGIGISKKDMERIFEPFYTRKKMGRSGSGLGMAVVWGTVKDHKGYIDIESTEGRGSRLTLYFPITREQSAETGPRLPFSDYQGNGETVLVVDDSKVQREIAVRILESLGYTVSAVPSGEEAVACIRQGPVDLLVLDMIMAPGIDGLETFRRIVQFNPGQKAVIASGFSETERVRKAQQLGAGQYIRKPYTIETIGLAVKEELARG